MGGGAKLPTMGIRVVRPQNMHDARARLLKGFEGQYLPIYYCASVRPTNDEGSYVYVLVQQGAGSRFVSSTMTPFPSPAGSKTACNPDFFVEGSFPPRAVSGKVPGGSPIVVVTIDMRRVNMPATYAVTVAAYTSNPALVFAPPPGGPLLPGTAIATWRLDAAGWAEAATAREVTTMSIESGGAPSAKLAFRQDFQEHRELRTLGPKPRRTHEELGAYAMIRLFVGRGLGMQQGATEGNAFAGEYVPVAIFTDEVRATTYMSKRNGAMPALERPMSEAWTPDGRVLYHPDFFYPPQQGEPGAQRPIRGSLKPNAPVVSLRRDLTATEQAEMILSRVTADTEPLQNAARVTQLTLRRGETPTTMVDMIPLTVTHIPDRRLPSAPARR